MKARILLPALLVCIWAMAFASTDISNVPMAVQNSAKPNVMYTVDDSGGMDVDVLFATYNSMYYEPGIKQNANLNGFFYLFPGTDAGSNGSHQQANLYGGTNGQTPDGNSSYNPDNNAWVPRYYGTNPQFYNPYVTYQPWAGVDNTGQAFANANPTNILLNPYDPVNSSTYDVTQSVQYRAYSYLYGGSYRTWLFPASYFVLDSNSNPVLYQITPSVTSYPSGRGYSAELQNFANWFQYYRTVFLALQAAVGQSLTLMSTTRVGMTDLEVSTPLSPVADMSSSANISNMQGQVYSLQPNLKDWRQPIHERIATMWSYYNTPAGNTNPSPPIQYACQQNFHILVTPGYLNENGSGARGFKNYFTQYDPGSGGTRATYDSAMGVPYADQPKGTDTLADWTAYYYDQTLRTDLATGKVPLPSGSHETNSNLHVTTYVLAPGSVPVVASAPTYQNPQNTNPYTANPSISWPIPCFVCQSTVDDLWHAAVNGRGLFINTSNVAAGLNGILNDILSRSGGAAALAVSNTIVTKGDNASYVSSYNSGTWSGDMQAYPIDLSTGVPNTATPTWSSGAQAQLDAQSWTSRYIASYSGSRGVAFTTAGLTAAQLARLNSPVSPPGTSDNATVVNFLRGDRSNEGTLYRKRSHVLGDTINSQPAFVGTPGWEYVDAGYAVYKKDMVSRTKMVYIGANDGMLHAFDATTGAEQWAYVPSLLFQSNDNTYKSTSSLVNLTNLNGFSHLYYVDGTPVAQDVDLNNAPTSGGTPKWATILVGGLNSGGQGYYALNVTTPTAASDTDVASKVMWEFPNANTTVAPAPSGNTAPANPLTTGISSLKNIGLSYGKPVIVKAPGIGWVALLTSGYNNGSDTGGDGHGRLFVLNAVTGSLLADIDTGVGTPGNPSGLAQIAAYSNATNLDDTIDYVYGGDLYGNVWRFNLTGGNPNHWSVQLLASLADANGVSQPVTSAPEIGLVNGTRLIFVGTGQYLGTSDITGSTSANSHASQTQSLYALIDNMKPTPTISNVRTSLVQQTLAVAADGVDITDTNSAVDFAAKSGWFVDFPNTGERVVTDPTLARGVLAFTTDIPSTDVCSPGGTSNQYFLNEATGGLVPGQTYAGSQLGSALSSSPELIELPNGTIIVLVRQSDGTIKTTTLPGNGQRPTAVRVSWRELLNQ